MQVLWEGYRAAMQEAGFDNQTPLYTASGLLAYGATQGKTPTASQAIIKSSKWSAVMSRNDAFHHFSPATADESIP